MVPLRPLRWTLSESRFANCSHVNTYDRGRVVSNAGSVSPAVMRDIERALRTHLGMTPVERLGIHEREVRYRLAAEAAKRDRQRRGRVAEDRGSV